MPWNIDGFDADTAKSFAQRLRRRLLAQNPPHDIPLNVLLEGVAQTLKYASWHEAEIALSGRTAGTSPATPPSQQETSWLKDLLSSASVDPLMPPWLMERGTRDASRTWWVDLLGQGPARTLEVLSRPENGLPPSDKEDSHWRGRETFNLVRHCFECAPASERPLWARLVLRVSAILFGDNGADKHRVPLEEMVAAFYHDDDWQRLLQRVAEKRLPPPHESEVPLLRLLHDAPLSPETVRRRWSELHQLVSWPMTQWLQVAFEVGEPCLLDLLPDDAVKDLGAAAWRRSLRSYSKEAERSEWSRRWGRLPHAASPVSVAELEKRRTSVLEAAVKRGLDFGSPVGDGWTRPLWCETLEAGCLGEVKLLLDGVLLDQAARSGFVRAAAELHRRSEHRSHGEAILRLLADRGWGSHADVGWLALGKIGPVDLIGRLMQAYPDRTRHENAGLLMGACAFPEAPLGQWMESMGMDWAFLAGSAWGPLALRSAIKGKNRDAVVRLLEAGVPTGPLVLTPQTPADVREESRNRVASENSPLLATMVWKAQTSDSTPSERAYFRGIVELLLQHGANPNETGVIEHVGESGREGVRKETGAFPLQWAVDSDLAELLLKAGADPRLTSENGRSLLASVGAGRLAEDRGSAVKRTRDLLLAHGAPLTPDLLFQAVGSNDLPLLSWLIEKGVDLNARNVRQETVDAILEHGKPSGIKAEIAHLIRKGREASPAPEIRSRSRKP